MRSLFALTTLTLVASAGAQAGPPRPLTGTAWTLTGLTDAGRLVMLGSRVPRPTLRLDGGAASGSTGCNVYRANYAARGDVLRLTALSMTRRACPDPLTGLEDRFVNLLGGVTRYALSGRTLTLFVGKSDRLVFAAAGAAAPARTEVGVMLDGSWTLSGGTALRPVAGHTPTLTFAGERVTGSGGCNRLTGTARISGEIRPASAARR